MHTTSKCESSYKVNLIYFILVLALSFHYHILLTSGPFHRSLPSTLVHTLRVLLLHKALHSVIFLLLPFLEVLIFFSYHILKHI
jgi:hypothetical protein